MSMNRWVNSGTPRRSTAGLTALALGAAMGWVGSAQAVTVLANLDQEVSEAGAEDASDNGVVTVTYGGSGTNTTMNARYNGSGGATAGDGTISTLRNEFIVVRFDLSGVDKSTITEASLNFVTSRDVNYGKDQRIWGVNSGVAGLNTFAEGSSFADTPGLLADNDITTQVIAADTSFLGGFNIAGFLGGEPSTGATVTISQAMLDGSGAGGDVAGASILQYLQSLAVGDQAVFLIGGVNSGGQMRFNTKEASAADTPTLTYTAVPEPASFALMGLGGLLMIQRRRVQR